MTNWHISEDPYPGPSRHKMADEIEIMSKKFREAGYSAMHVGKRMSGVMARLVEHEEFKKLYEQIAKTEQYFPIEEDPIIETPRERALRFTKTRSTGPQSEWIFDRDGTRRY